MIKENITKKIKNELIKEKSFPPYMRGIINLINNNAQATRPKVIGQLTEYFKEFLKLCPNGSINEWEKFYLKKEPEGFEKALKKILPMFKKCSDIFELINEEYIKAWQKDLIITKTYQGLNYEFYIRKYLKKKYKAILKTSIPEDESKNIDFYLNEIPIQIKPFSYKKTRQIENIKVEIVYYEIIKKNKNIIIEYSDSLRNSLIK